MNTSIKLNLDEVTLAMEHSMPLYPKYPLYHKNFLSKYNSVLNQKHDKLPFLYFTAKMHKKPASSRFITSGRFSSHSELSVKVGRWCFHLNVNDMLK